MLPGPWCGMDCILCLLYAELEPDLHNVEKCWLHVFAMAYVAMAVEYILTADAFRVLQLQAHTTEYMLGNYYGKPAGEVVTPFSAIKASSLLLSMWLPNVHGITSTKHFCHGFHVST